MTNQDNNDLEKIQNKFDLKQFSEYQIAISKQLIHEEFEKNRKELNKYKFKFWVSIFALIGLTGLASFYTWGKIINNLNSKVSKKLEAEVSRIDTTIQKRLDYEFSTQRIIKLVENKAQEYTEKNAKQYIETKVNNKINPFIQSAELKISQIDISVLEAKIYNDDKIAYDKLKSIYGRTHTQEVKDILSNISLEFLSYSDFWKFPEYLPHTLFPINDKLTPVDSIQTETLFTYLANRTNKYETQMLLMFSISKRPKTDVLKHALSTLKTSKSIKACVSTSNMIMYILKKQGNYMDFDKWITVIEQELNK